MMDDDLALLTRIPLESNPLNKLIITGGESSSKSTLPPFVGRPVSSLSAVEQAQYFAPFVHGENGNMRRNGVSDFNSTADFLMQWCTRGEEYRKAATDAATTLATIMRELDHIKREPFSTKPAPHATRNVGNSNFDSVNSPALTYVNVEGERQQQQQQQQQKKRPRKILFSFNGGKDNMAILHLLSSVFTLREIQEHVVFFVHQPPESDGEEWPEAVSFRDWVIKHVLTPSSSSSSSSPISAEHGGEIDFRICRGQTLREHLWNLVEEFAVESVLIGTRSTDPSGRWQSGCRSPTTASWPPVTLVSPIFRWNYKMIWEYSLALDVPRCVLYDRGFTSLGPRTLTVPNEALKLGSAQQVVGGGEDEEEEYTYASPSCYSPAWRLENQSLERANRLAAASGAEAEEAPPELVEKKQLASSI